MISIKHRTTRQIGLKVIIIFSAGLILLCGMNIFHDSGDIVELKSASADVRYGIQGQQAPELKLTNWIDGNGLSIDPIELNDYRDTVVYLYFFQDW